MKKLEYYYINRGTCAVIPIDKELSQIYEINDSYVVEKSVRQIIEESCKYYGCSYKGRVEGSKKMLNMTYKLPIVIEEFHNLIFFPTSSPRFGSCIWLSLNNIVNYEKIIDGSKIIFNNNREIVFEISYYSLENQIFRASLLESIITRRRNS